MRCSADMGCTREVLYPSLRLCSGHYQQHRSGKPFTLLRHFKGRPAPMPCGFNGCQKESRAHGYCAGHLKQRSAHGDMWPLGRPPGSVIVPTYGGCSIVRLSNSGAPCVIDSNDASLVSSYRWFRGAGGYAQASSRTREPDRKLWMHRIILGISDDNARQVQTDHVDGNRLNNRRSNLRVVTPAQNAQTAVRPNRRTMRGVFFDKRTRRYHATVTVNRKIISGGWHATSEAARVVARSLRAQHLTHHNEERHA